MNLENPLLISLLIYVPLCLVLYYTKPSFLFDDDNSDDDNDDESDDDNDDESDEVVNDILNDDENDKCI